MTPDKPRRHHYVPEMLLRNFTNRKGRLWAYDKTRARLFSTIPKNVFVVRDLYAKSEFDSAQGSENYLEFRRRITKSYEYEDRLSEIEGRAAPVIRRIVKEARRSKCPRLSHGQSDAFKQFALTLARRTPESQLRARSNLDFDDVFYGAAKSAAKVENLPIPEKETLYADTRVWELKELIETNTSAKFAAGVDPRLQIEEQKFCRSNGLAVAIIRNSDKRFIIGSHGISRVASNSTSDLAHGDWFPIAPDVAVTHTPHPTMEYLLPIDTGNDYVVDRINDAFAGQSWLIAGRTESLVRSFM